MAIKAETTPGTYETIADADFNLRLRNIEITPNIAIDDEGAKYANGNHAEDESLHGAQSVTVKCSCRVAWGGAVAVAPDWWKLANACGCGTLTIYSAAGRSIVGRQAYDDVTASIVVADKEIGSSGGPVTTLYKCAGCIGEMTIHADKPGDPWIADFEFQGKLVDVVDGTALVLTAPAPELGEMFLSNVCTVDGVARKISKFSFKTGNTITPIVDQSNATGYSHFVITKRQPRFSCDPLAVKQATTDWLNDLLTENTGTITLATAASSPHLTLVIPRAQPLTTSLASREGLVAWENNYKCLSNGPSAGSLVIAALTYEDTWELLQGARS
jgi:hypothetical protein